MDLIQPPDTHLEYEVTLIDYKLTPAARREIVAQIPVEYRFINSGGAVFDARFPLVQYSVREVLGE